MSDTTTTIVEITDAARDKIIALRDDFVCHGLDMEKEFFSRMRQDLPHLEGAQLRDYRDLFNPYREADGTPNPHKVFGYLVQPKLATRLCRLLRKIDAE